MGFVWPSISQVFGDVADPDIVEIKAVLNRFAEHLESALATRGLGKFSSQWFRPWNIFLVANADQLAAAFSPAAGIASHVFAKAEIIGDARPQVVRLAWEQRGERAFAAVQLPRFTRSRALHAVQDNLIKLCAEEQADELEKELALNRLGDVSGLENLEPALRAFLQDHPDPEKNFFIMMRFQDSEHQEEIHSAIKSALAERGLHALRADDRDYTGELWSNIEVYLTGSKYGIAVFEDIDQRDFNPNVALELGYMMGKRKRCLMLKENRLPAVPTDVLHKLYRPFNMFKITETIHQELGEWLDKDLRVTG